jgi:hypothetical protein
LAGPKLGQAAALDEGDNRGGSAWGAESAAFLQAIEVINAQRPAFVVVCGDFVNAKPSQEFYDAQVAAFQDLLSRIIPHARLVDRTNFLYERAMANKMLLQVFAAGSGEFETQEELAKY